MQREKRVDDGVNEQSSAIVAVDGKESGVVIVFDGGEATSQVGKWSRHLDREDLT